MRLAGRRPGSRAFGQGARLVHVRVSRGRPGAGIDPSLTFDDALAAVPSGGGFYDVLGVGDSLVRERVFRELSDRGDIDYGTIYDSWITGTPVTGPMPDGVTGIPGMDGTMPHTGFSL